MIARFPNVDSSQSSSQQLFDTWKDVITLARFRSTSSRITASIAAVYIMGCFRKRGVSMVSIRTFLDQRRYDLRGRQCSKMRKRGPDRALSWWWQYKARPVAGLSQSVSGTYTFKVRVLEGDTRLRPSRVPLHEEDRRWASRGRNLAWIFFESEP